MVADRVRLDPLVRALSPMTVSFTPERNATILNAPLYDAQGTDVTRPRVDFSNDPPRSERLNREDQEQNDEGGNDQKSNHGVLL